MKEEYQDKGRFTFHLFRDLVMQETSKPMNYLHLVKMDMVLLNDPEVISMANDLIPSKIDREPLDNSGIGRIAGTGGMSQMKSSEEWKNRRNTFMKVVGINYASRYIPTFIKYLKRSLGKLNVDEEYNMSQIATNFSYDIIQAVLFGNNIEEKADLCNYEDAQGNVTKLNLYDVMLKITDDCTEASMKIWNVLFPQFIAWDIGRENKRNSRNSNEIIRVLKKFLNESEDKTSVYHTVSELLHIDPHQVYLDTKAFLKGGFHTMSETFCSALFFLKKYPQHFETLRAELKEKLLGDKQ